MLKYPYISKIIISKLKNKFIFFVMVRGHNQTNKMLHTPTSPYPFLHSLVDF
jgi:urate oxidase